MNAFPFAVWQIVVYRPTARGYGWSNMTHDLVPGRRYEISGIADGRYIALKGQEMTGGGLYWTEFSADQVGLQNI